MSNDFSNTGYQDTDQPQAYASSALVDPMSVESQDQRLAAMTQAAISQFRNDPSFTNPSMSDANCITTHLKLNFKWTGSSGAPPKVMLTEKAVSDMFGNKFKGDKPVFAKRISILQTHSTAPYPLELTLSGIETSNDSEGVVKHEFDSQGNACTFTINTGAWNGDETVYEMNNNIDVGVLAQHGNVDLLAEAQALCKFSEHYVSVHANSALGQVVQADPERALAGWNKDPMLGVNEFDPNHGLGRAVLQQVSATMPNYFVHTKNMQDIIDHYNENVIKKLPSSKLHEVVGELKRGDRGATSDLAFGNASDAAGVTKSNAAVQSSLKHSVFVKARISIINPKLFEQ